MKTIFKRGKDKTAQEPRGERRGIRSRILAFWFSEEDGNSLVEFTLTLPILMAVLVAIFQFGIAFNNQLTLTQGVGTAAQYLQTIRISTTDPCKDTITAIQNSAPQLTPANISLTLTMNGTAVSGSSCSGSQSNLVPGGPVKVAASYPCNITILGINLGGVYKRSFSCNLTAQVTEYEY
jgi:Flp pilus assembly protein TadG